jgi:hypothetical protein
MAKVQKTVTFDLPDEFEQEVPTTSMGKTSTMPYDGPETLMLWINKETKDIEQTWDKDDYTEQPVPLDLEVKELNADTDENTIKIGILFGGFEQRKLYEIRVGPVADKNRVIADPSDPRSIFSENDIVDDYTKPLVFRTDFRRYSNDFIRSERNALLKQTDSRVSESMPAEVKAKWEAHRQKLRDMPADWDAVPNHMVQFPMDPDGEYDEPYVRNEDPEHEVILVANRTAADADAIAQLTPISGIDE